MREPANSYRRYLRQAAIAFLASSGVVIALCWLSDPFGAYDMPSVKGINHYRPAYHHNVRLSKSEIMRRREGTQAIILGSSTAEVGLNPAHPGWDDKVVFNLGISGASMLEAKEFALHAMRFQPIRHVMLQADFMMFNAYWGASEAGIDRSYYSDAPKDRINVFLRTLYSSYALAQVYENLYRSREAIRRRGDVPYMANGQRGWEYFAHRMLRGHYGMFYDKEKEYLSRSLFGNQHGKFEFIRDGNPQQSTFVYFRQLLEAAAEKGAKTTILITPVHARMLLVYEQVGLLERYGNWRRELTRIVAEHNARHPQAPAILWDFSLPSYFTTEEVPEKDQLTRRMRYYWEGIHYHNALGDMMLDRVFGRTGSLPQLAEFGAVLTPDAIEAHLRREVRALAGYKRTHARDVAQIRAISEEVGQLRP